MPRGEASEEAATSSPNTQVKLLCSYGGKILRRPSDGQLRYVGGETRAVSFPHSVTFKELKEKIAAMFSHPGFVIKYQVFPEDLETLVSVRCDEDLHHMLEEYDRHHSLQRSPCSSSRFRIFLLPSPSATPPCTSPTYLDLINGSVSGSINLKYSLSIRIPRKPPTHTVTSSSACSSPSDSSPVKDVGLLDMGPKSGMQRVRSTPNLSCSSGHFGNNHSGTNLSPGGGLYTHHYHHQPHQNKGMMGYGGSGMSRMVGPHRQERCGCTCWWGCALSAHQSQRRYYYPPSVGYPCWCRVGGHGEEPHSPRSSHSSINGRACCPLHQRGAFGSEEWR